MSCIVTIAGASVSRTKAAPTASATFSSSSSGTMPRISYALNILASSLTSAPASGSPFPARVRPVQMHLPGHRVHLPGHRAYRVDGVSTVPMGTFGTRRDCGQRPDFNHAVPTTPYCRTGHAVPATPYRPRRTDRAPPDTGAAPVRPTPREPARRVRTGRGLAQAPDGGAAPTAVPADARDGPPRCPVRPAPRRVAAERPPVPRSPGPPGRRWLAARVRRATGRPPSRAARSAARRAPHTGRSNAVRRRTQAAQARQWSRGIRR